jgi:hypothetical protein
MQRVTKAMQANPLFFAFLLPMVTDSALTLVGQAPSYWQSCSTI